MKKQMKPTQQNNKLLADVVAMKIKKSMEQKHPTAESIVNDLLNENRR